ncbi:tRNA pseudouridine synthase B [Methylococcaceae bacterium]|nr:tRNA pseudouridine synthase B [Methylococcaceae bacterium]
MSKRTSGLNVHGIIFLDKRLGISSNKALQEVRRLFNANKAGHTGSLDPLATGLLPLCFGEATKVSALMLDDDKRYQVTVKLGVMTDTGDAEGQIIETKPVPRLSLAEIQACLVKFTGAQAQVPPMYSALKHNGKKLYELAREGITIEREPRNITIYEINLLEFTHETLTLDVACSKGTYIRSLAEDIGHDLGCGGTVTALRRTQAGQFHLDEAKTIEQLSAMTLDELHASLMPIDKPLENLLAIHLSPEQAKAISFGQAIDFKTNESTQNVRLYAGSLFLGLGEVGLNDKITTVRLFNLND